MGHRSGSEARERLNTCPLIASGYLPHRVRQRKRPRRRRSGRTSKSRNTGLEVVKNDEVLGSDPAIEFATPLPSAENTVIGVERGLPLLRPGYRQHPRGFGTGPPGVVMGVISVVLASWRG